MNPIKENKEEIKFKKKKTEIFFYSILFLKADVYKLRENPQTHTFSSRLVAVLKKGSSFGVRKFVSRLK